jgi:hypothetical protein
MGYALSPKGRLIPDRKIVTKSARESWQGVFNGKRPRLKLDDKEHKHELPGNKYHTDDPSDDCKLQNADFLNYAYESEGWEKVMRAKLEDNHRVAMEQIPEHASRVEKIFQDAGFDFFGLHFHNNPANY